MNPSHVVYGACTRDCGVEGYGGPQGPRKLLDNGDFGLATWEHQSPSPLLRVLQCGIPAAIPAINLHILTVASIPAAVNQRLLVAQAPQQPSNHFPFSLWLLQAFQQPSQPFLNHYNQDFPSSSYPFKL
ncbi:hypothetical protein Pyn_23122 [Prunus yedoensis var. nudiflora]|uniref:Uncharacterized protein n=1 Tax=Prunus yedoensis var. nudiflora TaxID=2094558 RepID=A0A314YAT0_PRUYE|nr:hypothetical protein Pyn_23122 [Prunus yedoensis var. nudiflora]